MLKKINIWTNLKKRKYIWFHDVTSFHQTFTGNVRIAVFVVFVCALFSWLWLHIISIMVIVQYVVTSFLWIGIWKEGLSTVGSGVILELLCLHICSYICGEYSLSKLVLFDYLYIISGLIFRMLLSWAGTYWWLLLEWIFY